MLTGGSNTIGQNGNEYNGHPWPPQSLVGPQRFLNGCMDRWLDGIRLYAGLCGLCEISDVFYMTYITEAEAHPLGLWHAAPVRDEETQEGDTVLPSGRFISMVTAL